MVTLSGWERLLLLGLALWQAIEVWHHGDLFAEPRAFFRTWLDSPWRAIRWPGKLINCMFCLSLWVGTALVAASFLAGENVFVQIGVWALAVTRCAQLGNDLTHAWCRSPPSDVIVERDELTLSEPPGR